MNESFFEDLKQLIQENELDTAIEQFLNYLKALGNNNDYDTAILIASQYNQLKKDIREFTISEQSAMLTKSQIKGRLLDFINDISKKAKKLPRSQSPNYPINIKPSSFEKIIGEKSNLKKISWVEKVFEVEKSICRVVNSGFGTGFLLSDGWLVTNNHVISNKEEAAITKIEFNYQEDLRGKMLQYYSYELDPSTFVTNEHHDVSKVKIKADANLPPLSQWKALTLSSKTPRVNDHVVIIQHPQGGPKQIAMTENKIINIYDKYLHYTTDTMPGSSGSPVFNDDWEVVGLHHAGGDMRKNETGDIIFANEAILINKIKEAISI